MIEQIREESSSRQTFAQALPPQEGHVVVINQDLVSQSIHASRESPRRRIILPFHKSDASSLHRMLNAVQPGSYIRPHWHRNPLKDESLILLQGGICVFIFSDDGGIQQRIRLAAGTHDFGIDLVAGVCHTFIALEEDTVVYEFKPGPYVRATDKDFVPWEPVEGTDQAREYLARLYASV